METLAQLPDDIIITFGKDKYWCIETQNTAELTSSSLFSYINEIGKRSGTSWNRKARKRYFNAGVKTIAKRATMIAQNRGERRPISNTEVRSIVFIHQYIQPDLFSYRFVLPYRVCYILDAIRALTQAGISNPLNHMKGKLNDPTYVDFAIRNQQASLRVYMLEHSQVPEKVKSMNKAVREHQAKYKIKSDWHSN